MVALEISYTVVAERLVLAAVLGGMIGWERERRNKQAGFKTHLLVSVGSALIMLTSIYGFGDLVDHPNARFDPARLAAQVVSGIGFLGAGAILRHSNMVVSGLTTAATLWVVAAIGLSVGAGFYFPAVATTGIVLISVVVLRGVEVRFAKKKVKELNITVEDVEGTLVDISDVLDKERVDVRKVTFSTKQGGEEAALTVVKFRIRMPAKKDSLELVNRLHNIHGVKEVQLNK
ncbi:magnesium transporter MgtC [Novibacillus thermophilus]|uniref:Magnesium transporter MgtC n=1 Tax=Novibacillus thermophilus TaxID=1471761 RepID=A0A1U9K8T6_9BACL|nr:magnesium transporter MgtC [Novibacillus thermophilus]